MTVPASLTMRLPGHLQVSRVPDVTLGRGFLWVQGGLRGPLVVSMVAGPVQLEFKVD